MKKYSRIFFDLDRTLWDYERNADEAIRELLVKYALDKKGIEDAGHFISEYSKINDYLWEEYSHNRVTKEELRSQRFHLAFLKFNINAYDIAQLVSADFTELACQKPYLIPGTVELLKYLHPKYPLHLITNGFEKTQKIKLHHSRIGHFFSSMISSERARSKKPAKEIFEFALLETGERPEDCLMIGDHYKFDALASMAVGMDAVYFAPDNQEGDQATHTIRDLLELKAII